MKSSLFFCFFLFWATQVSAQRVGIGAQFGEPTGLTVRVNNNHGANLDILGAWNFGEYFFLNIHGLWERRVFDIPQFHYFYGPGLFVGSRGLRNHEVDNMTFGISGSVGLNLYLGPIELFGQLTPRFSVFPSTAGEMGGGIGGRYYFKR